MRKRMGSLVWTTLKKQWWITAALMLPLSGCAKQSTASQQQIESAPPLSCSVRLEYYETTPSDIFTESEWIRFSRSELDGRGSSWGKMLHGYVSLENAGERPLQNIRVHLDIPQRLRPFDLKGENILDGQPHPPHSAERGFLEISDDHPELFGNGLVVISLLPGEETYWEFSLYVDPTIPDSAEIQYTGWVEVEGQRYSIASRIYKVHIDED